MAEQSLATDPASAGKTLAEQRENPKYWVDTITEQVKLYTEWNTKVDNIEHYLYSAQRLSADAREREMAVAWANSEVLKPAVYINPPVPAVASRYKDRKPLVRHCAEIIERSRRPASTWKKYTKAC
jgi:hypothetical protein